MAQVKGITSESLERSYRNLTPSQQGFTEDLQASNVILPIIDLTSSAEGSSVGENLQTALSTNTTVTNVTAGPTTIVNNTGFWRLIVNLTGDTSAGSIIEIANLDIYDGTTATKIWRVDRSSAGGDSSFITGQFVVFIDSGNSLRGTVATSNVMNVTASQIADINGTLVNPAGFTPQ